MLNDSSEQAEHTRQYEENGHRTDQCTAGKHQADRMNNIDIRISCHACCRREEGNTGGDDRTHTCLMGDLHGFLPVAPTLPLLLITARHQDCIIDG